MSRWNKQCYSVCTAISITLLAGLILGIGYRYDADLRNALTSREPEKVVDVPTPTVPLVTTDDTGTPKTVLYVKDAEFGKVFVKLLNDDPHWQRFSSNALLRDADGGRIELTSYGGKELIVRINNEYVTDVFSKLELEDMVKAFNARLQKENDKHAEKEKEHKRKLLERTLGKWATQP